ncbi:MAG: c-type cytochrome [Gemmataceae bacterium]
MPRDETSATLIVDGRCLNDSDAGVRLAALLALAEMPGTVTAWSVALMAAEDRNVNDRWISQAAVAAAAPSGVKFLLAPAAKPEALRVVAGHVVRGDKVDLASLFEAAATKLESADAILGGIAANWPARRPMVFDGRAEAALKNLMDLIRRNDKIRQAVLPSLAALLKAGGKADALAAVAGDLTRTLAARVADATLGEAERLAAARDLVTLGSDAEAVKLVETISGKATPTWARGVLDALAESRSDAIGPAVVGRWEELTPSVRGAAVALLARRAAWAKALVDGVEAGKVDKGDLSVDQAQLLTRHPDKALAERATKVLASGGKLPNPDRRAVVERLMAVAKQPGDKARGRAVFEANCAKCHKHGDLGNSVGPDLTGMAVREKAELLIEVLDPNRSVEGNYQQYSATTKRGTSIQGLLVSETKTAVELLDAENKRHVVLRDDLEELFNTKRSLMPEGFETLPPSDLASLLTFLTAFDRYLPLPLNKAATITSVRGMFNNKEDTVERLVFKTWGTQTFAGVPFQVIDPRDGSVPNVVLLQGPSGAVSREMPKSVSVQCNAPVKTLHLLGGVAGWASPGGREGSVSMIVRFVYADGKTEDHELKNGVEMADYNGLVEVPGSKLAFNLGGRQVRYLALTPKRPTAKVEKVEFVKGTDRTAPLVVAATVEVGG